MDDHNKQKEPFDLFLKFMQVHLFGLVAFIARPNRNEHFPIASGILIESEGVPVVMTAGHYLESVKRWREEARLEGLFLLVHNHAGICTPISIKLHEVWPVYCSNYDLGFFILNQQTLLKIKEHGGALTSRELLSLTPQEFATFYLVGHMSRYCKVESQVISTSQRGDKTVAWKISKPTDIACAVSKLEFEKKGDNPGTFRFSLVKG